MTNFTSGFTSLCLAGASLALSIVGMATAQDPPRFQVTDLGALGFFPNPDDEGTFGINNHGEVVFSMDVNGQRHAMLWLPEPAYGQPAGNHDLADFFPPFAQPSIARDISVNGQVVGQVGGIEAGAGQAVVWDLTTGEFRLLGALPDGTWSRAMAINDATPAQAVGESEIISFCNLCSQQNQGPILRSFEVTLVQGPLTLVELKSLGDLGNCPEQWGPSSFARDVSIPAAGQPHIAGFSHVQGFLPLNCSGVLPSECQSKKEAVVWEVTDTPIELRDLDDLGDPPDLRDSQAHGVNNAGESVGFGFRSGTPQCRPDALYWKADLQLTNLGLYMPPSQPGQPSRAEAINALSLPQAVGWNTAAELAVLWENQPGTPPWKGTDLNTVIGPCGGTDPTIDLLQAHDINDSSWIVCVGRPDPGTERHVYVLRPINTCLYDLNGDGTVGILDLLAVLASWGPCTPGEPCFADFNCDGSVGILDLLALLANWGLCPGTSGQPPKSLQQEIEDAGLVWPDDWDKLVDIMQNGTQDERDNAVCWFDYYIVGCGGGLRPVCPDADPFNDCRADLNGDCVVDSADLTILLGAWAAGTADGDINGDCVTDSTDMTLLLGAWGRCPCSGQGAQGGGSGPAALGAALAMMGFTNVGEFQAHVTAHTDAEAFTCGCVLEVLLSTQP